MKCFYIDLVILFFQISAPEYVENKFQQRQLVAFPIYDCEYV